MRSLAAEQRREENLVPLRVGFHEGIRAGMKSDPPVEIFPSVLDPHMNNQMRIEDFVAQTERKVIESARIFRKLPVLFRQLRIRYFSVLFDKKSEFVGRKGDGKGPALNVSDFPCPSK